MSVQFSVFSLVWFSYVALYALYNKTRVRSRSSVTCRHPLPKLLSASYRTEIQDQRFLTE